MKRLLLFILLINFSAFCMAQDLNRIFFEAIIDTHGLTGITKKIHKRKSVKEYNTKTTEYHGDSTIVRIRHYTHSKNFEQFTIVRTGRSTYEVKREFSFVKDFSWRTSVIVHSDSSYTLLHRNTNSDSIVLKSGNRDSLMHINHYDKKDNIEYGKHIRGDDGQVILTRVYNKKGIYLYLPVGIIRVISDTNNTDLHKFVFIC